MPSAPTMTSASASLPSANRATARCPPPLPAPESTEQVGPVRGHALDPERRRLLLPARAADQPAGYPIAQDRRIGSPRDRAHAVLGADAAQYPHRIGMQRDARPDLLELRGRLIDRHLDPGP
jgi:hypothetical protein